MFSKALAFTSITTLQLALAPPVLARRALLRTGEAMVEVSDQAWESGLRNPNATGSVPVVGFNVSRPWPARDTRDDDWTLDAKLVADLPTKWEEDGEFYTGISLTLSPPDYLVKKLGNGTEVLDVDITTWQGCVTIITNLPEEVQEQGYDDDGSCRSVLGDNCVDDYLAAMLDTQGFGEVCHAPPLPESCEGKFGGGAVTMGFHLNDTRLLNGPTITFSSDETHKKGNTSSYETMVKSAYPVLFGFAGKNLYSLDPQPPYEEGDYGSFACIRPNETTPGSKKVEMDDGSDASRLSLATSMVASVALAVILL
ncbi:hypothetical protein ACO1O0_008305 [Amphichorda felina]